MGFPFYQEQIKHNQNTMVPKIDKVENVNDIPAEFSRYFVVLRNGRRVSDTNHLTESEAFRERMYWENIVRQWPDGSRITVQSFRNINYNSPR